MTDNLILQIEQDMAHVLSNGQMEQLHKVLKHYFYNIEIIKKDTADEIDNDKINTELLTGFLSAKNVEGCSKKSLKYYKSTIENLFKIINKSVKSITTNDLREYLDKYQKNGGAGKVTIDNIRRILSSFFHGLKKRTIF